MGRYCFFCCFFLSLAKMRARIPLAVLIPLCLAAAIRLKRHLLSRPAALGGVLVLTHHPCCTNCHSRYSQNGMGMRFEAAACAMKSTLAKAARKGFISPPANTSVGSRSFPEDEHRSFEIHKPIESCKSKRRRWRIEAASPSGASHAAKVVRGEPSPRSDRQ